MPKVAVNTLEAYAAELGLESITQAALIASHRHLRSLNLELEDTIDKALEKANKLGEERAYNDAVEFGWLSRERCRKMSMAEFGEWIEKNA